MTWNEIVNSQEACKEQWEKNIAGVIIEFDPALMMAVMDHITVFEDGRLQIRFYDGTEYEVETE